jgi:GAF domain-containing protein
MPSDQPDSAAPSPESARLAALHRYEILDTPAEAEFDDFTRLAAHICGTPIALISLVDQNRQWFKSERGLGMPETPLELSICRHAIQQPGLFVVPDTTLDDRFCRYPNVVGEPHLRFYAGAPLKTLDGHTLGTLCVLDHQPRTLTEAQSDAIRLLARQVMVTLELRLIARELAHRNTELEAARRELKTLEGLLPICAKCKKIRDDDQQWVPVDTYLHEHSDVDFTHSLCPGCAQFYFGQVEAQRPTP